MEKEQSPIRIRYEYEQDKDLVLSYAHGVWGGINPQGEIEMNFYIESDKVPPFSERIVLPDGSMGHEMAPHDDNLKLVTRRINSRLLLNYSTARSVLEWLEEKVDMLEHEAESAGSFFDEGTGLAQ